MIHPPKLESGDTVALVASSSHQPIEEEHLVGEAVELLQSWGLQVRLQQEIHDKHFYLAGSDRHRACCLERFYLDPKIKALFFTRGGYGASRLLRFLDHEKISLQRKIVVGYSDVTSLLLYFQKVCDMVVYHGPNLATRKMLELEERNQSQASIQRNLFKSEEAFLPQHAVDTLKSGQACGQLIGGNLTLFCCSLATPYEPETEGRILFLEDVSEEPYRIDRKLTHLRNAGKFTGLKGIVFGEMVECEGENGLLWDVLAEFFREDPFPVAYNLRSGHGDVCLTLPLGDRVELITEADSGFVRFVN